MPYDVTVKLILPKGIEINLFLMNYYKYNKSIYLLQGFAIKKINLSS